MAKFIVEARPYETVSNKESFYTLLQVFGASIFIALSSQISIPLFFTPIPLTFQTLAVLLVGGMLGPKKGVASVLLYLAEGCSGFPVFAEAKFGFHVLFGTTGGYLAGFVLQAYLAGWIMEKPFAAHSNRLLATLVLACMAQMALGVVWLAHFVGWNNVLLMGFYPFIPGEILKSIAAAGYLALWKRGGNAKNTDLF